jgi:diguanylate cyclase (GGDEF)-like protein
MQWLVPCVLLLGWSSVANGQQAAITKAGEVHNLPGNLAAQRIPVHLIATVTYYEPAESTLFVADSSGAVYVRTSHPYPIHRGDLVRIDGFTGKSYRTVVASNPRMQVIGHGSLHRENVLTYESYRELMAGEWDCQYVVMHGIVRSSLIEIHGHAPVLELGIMMPGGLVQAFMQNFSGIDVEKLGGAQVEISGIVAGDFNAQWQLMRSVLYSSDASELRIVSEPKLRPSSLPLTAIDDVMQTRSINDRTPRIRVRGIVTLYKPGNTVVIQQDGRSLDAETRQIGIIPLGSVVDVIGFANAGGYGPGLSQAEIIPTGRSAPIEPTQVSYSQAFGGLYSNNLISMRGRLISQLHTDTSDTLSLMVDDHAVSAVLQVSNTEQPLPKLPIGAEVSVTGICRVSPTEEWFTPGATAMLFRIDMRSSDDLRVLTLPSWWTVAHLLVVVGALLAISLLIAFWAMILRRRVASQTATIERTMNLEMERSRLLEAINSEASLPQLLSSICRSIEDLVPGIRCCCSIKVLTHDATGTAEVLKIGAPPKNLLFEASLSDTKGSKMGTFRAGCDEVKTLSTFESEVLAVGTGLASLGINQRRMYQELNYTSTHDQLTGLPNRRLSELFLESALQQAASNGTRLGVAYIDVDRFKQVNDEHGHKIGDLYLQQISARLACQVRVTDKLARIGGDEFLLIATGLKSADDVDAYRTRLEECFEQTFLLDDCRICGSASIGVAVFPDHGNGSEELKRHADIDMYSAKRRRRSDQEQQWAPPAGSTDIFSAADLEAALESDSFTLFYQPQFSSKGELRGLEALIRLKDPILGIVTPDAFIGVAERNDVILPLGAWVLRQALADASIWQLDRMNGVRMVVNVSARQIEHPHFASDVAAALAEFDLPANCLELEITERTLARNIGEATSQLSQVHAAGVKISIDDFGTDHSCLSVLHKFPIDTLKIDRSFVRALHTEPEVRHIIRAIVSMGQAMDKRIVAEGVETLEDIEALLKLADMDFQGYFFSTPQSSHTIAANLPAWRCGVTIKK